MPVSIASAQRATVPMEMLAKPAERSVAARIDGLTKMVSDITGKVVQPTRVSVRQFVPSMASSKYFAT